MWTLSLPYWEFIARAVLVYVFVMMSLRLTGKRQIGELAPFDFVLLLLLSNGVQNAMNGGDNTVTAGFIITISLLSINGLVAWATYRSKTAEKVIEGRPEVLIHNGYLYSDVMKCNRITHHELNNALRQNDCVSIDVVRLAVLETNGHINVIKKDAAHA
ncbi:DUF421 domain-containing protein [Hydromonas duriensis]|uniref:Uncharacterized protein DUF421 n=1 Tax=Hydromonas duriensis TaxID=1527608 RepID=A0A4R6YBF2_9BURK|nr:YetF domain-containing protein [Hydromonas duriensis]TDR32965.1 uncharacterized protein DUF421 [Hydromonas duriensis]